MDILKKHVSLLGLKVRDKVTGFEGVVESVSFDLYGCVQAVVKPAAKDGEIKDGRWHDIQRLEVIDSGRVMPVPSFASLATPEGVHTHGPAEKPVR
jgi:hypothetical protein